VIKIPSFNKVNHAAVPINDTITKIKSGDKSLRDSFINDYKPFVLKIVSSVVKRYIEIENSEEYSIGLIAFNEAIDSYDNNKYSNFLKFAEQVIRRRIIDYIRNNQKNNRVLPFSYFEDDESSASVEDYIKVESDPTIENVELQDEILLFNKKLEAFDITIDDLVICAPKHADSKQLSIRIARVLAENKELYDKLLRKKTIPVVELMRCINVNNKTIERNRKYIIAICLILNSNLDDLKDYIRSVEKRGEKNGL
jgi:RNA polymerase sigma factor